MFATRNRKAPVHIHLHGGAWRSLSKSDASFPAPTFVNAGVHFIVPDFTNLPEVRLPSMVEQIRRAVTWVYQNAAQFDGDADRIYLSGHSSGAHLAAVILTTEWAERGLPDDLFKGCLCISGMYELTPVLLSARRLYIDLDTTEARVLSPLQHIDKIRCPVAVAVGDGESPEFLRHGSAFASALASARRTVQFLVEPELNHFEIAEELARHDSQLARIALNQVQRAINF